MTRRRICRSKHGWCRQCSTTAERGFTLIELLVALTILSLSVTVLFGIFSQTIHRTRADNRAMRARVLAQSLLAGAEARPPASDAQGTDNSGFGWRVHVVSAGGADDSSHGVSAETISATVHWNVGEADRSLTLSTLVTVPVESGQ